jgi:AcrR family transcriptional regulator
LLLETVNHTLDESSILRTTDSAAYPDATIERALTDVIHRTLFGRDTRVNVHVGDGAASPTLEFGPEMVELLGDDEPVGLEGSANAALVAILATGREVFVRRGYQSTRVDDLVEAAGVSHGAFYRYFKNKEELARILMVRGVRVVGRVVTEIPELSALEQPGGKSVLRRWLRRYHAAHANEAAMLRVWIDASLQDSAFRAEAGPLYDWGRRRMARFLAPRAFGDVDMDAVVMVALLGVFGARVRPAAEIDAAAHIIERGLLGR